MSFYGLAILYQIYGVPKIFKGSGDTYTILWPFPLKYTTESDINVYQNAGINIEPINLSIFSLISYCSIIYSDIGNTK